MTMQQQQQQQQQLQPSQTQLQPTAFQPTMQPAPMMMQPPVFRRIKARHTVYKVGIGLLFFSGLLFVVGYSAPAWIGQSGLWLSCGSDCWSNILKGPGWLEAVRVMETLALLLLFAAVAVFLYQDVFKSPPPQDNKAVEIIVGIATGFGLIGIIIYGAKIPQKLEMVDYYSNSYSYYYIRQQIQWGYGLATSGIILMLVSAVLIGYSRHKHALYTSQVMAAHGVYCPVPVQAPQQPMMMPMQQMQPMQPMPMAGGYMPYAPAYPYAYPYPPPAMTPMMAPTMMLPPQGMALPQGMPASQPGAPAAQTSQVPAFYVMTQGQMVPVYNQMPGAGAPVSASAPAPQQPTEPVGQPDVSPTQNGEARL